MAKVQIDEDTGSVMSGEYSVSPKPSLVLNPPGNARDRHLKSGIDIALFDRMNDNGHATRTLADIRNDPVAVVETVSPAAKPDVETFTDEEVREALYDDKFSGTLWSNVYPKDVERQLTLWRSIIDENQRQKADAEAWVTHNQVCLDGLERQKQEILEMVHSQPEFIAKRNRAARIREHIAKTVRSVKDECHISHVEWRQAEARGAAMQAQVEAKKKELKKLCKDWGFEHPVDVYVEFDRIEDFKARE
ncbi:hypothetical protein GQ53DRAFT_262512 [Thozetella sp. PMI_491]|nr:hypothetical protein GQ53DRAFT_262512 [Thozetella sp. PMI_491]